MVVLVVIVGVFFAVANFSASDIFRFSVVVVAVAGVGVINTKSAVDNFNNDIFQNHIFDDNVVNVGRIKVV